ncbi:hypothetical protein PanWU01x14_203610 [Parasponia andersonii]|uniref:Uncharacterized protein n=1 Tax=Parasponia andersonii TaxID=3476 RepID=A0A2P5BWT5_PARAD|nr:hypothetical protein PanWU01x14_203610 [Parasponia andersonii]
MNETVKLVETRLYTGCVYLLIGECGSDTCLFLTGSKILAVSSRLASDSEMTRLPSKTSLPDVWALCAKSPITMYGVGSNSSLSLL